MSTLYPSLVFITRLYHLHSSLTFITRIHHSYSSLVFITCIHHSHSSLVSITRIHHSSLSLAFVTHIHHLHSSLVSITCIHHSSLSLASITHIHYSYPSLVFITRLYHLHSFITRIHHSYSSLVFIIAFIPSSLVSITRIHHSHSSLVSITCIHHSALSLAFITHIHHSYPSLIFITRIRPPHSFFASFITFITCIQDSHSSFAFITHNHHSQPPAVINSHPLVAITQSRQQSLTSSITVITLCHHSFIHHTITHVHLIEVINSPLLILPSRTSFTAITSHQLPSAHSQSIASSPIKIITESHHSSFILHIITNKPSLTAITHNHSIEVINSQSLSPLRTFNQPGHPSFHTFGHHSCSSPTLVTTFITPIHCISITVSLHHRES
jgi:hypothetical protein